MASRHQLLVVCLGALSGCAQCPDPFAKPNVPPLTLLFPTGVAVHPREPVLFVSSSNGDDKYEGGAVMAMRYDWLVAELNLHGRIEEPVVDPWQTSALTSALGKNAGGHRGWFARAAGGPGQGLVVALDVEVRPDDVQLTCGEGVDRTRTERPVPECANTNRAFRTLVGDAYGLTVAPGPDNRWLVYVTFLNNGFVQALELHPDDDGIARLREVWRRDLGGNVRGGNLALLPGLFGQAPYLWGTGKSTNNSQFEGDAFLLNLWDVPNGPVLTGNFLQGASSLEVRGVAFNSAADTAYVVSRLPFALAKVDVTRVADGIPRLQVKNVVPLGKEPSMVALYEPPDAPPLVLTVSFRDNLVMALDAETMTTAGVIRDVCASPFDVAVDHGRGLAFVSCFNADSVAVIALPRTPDEDRFYVAARLGQPRGTSNSNPDLEALLQYIPVPSL